jgi:DNA-binding response OmpR family regulator
MTVINDLRDDAAAPATSNAVNQGGPRLLVIDDDAVHRTIICKMATKLGFDAVEAESCGDVVRLTSIGTFGCATLDLSLGERVGTEVLLHFSLCRFRAPIIILSGADAALTRSAYEFGLSLDLDMVDPVGKPVSLAELRERLTMVAGDLQSKRQAALPA